MQPLPFSAQAKTKPVSVTASASASTTLPSSGSTLRVVNAGPNTAFISVGTGTQTATLPNATPVATSTPVLAGSDVSFTIPSDSVLNISAICNASETATLYVAVGEGV